MAKTSPMLCDFDPEMLDHAASVLKVMAHPHRLLMVDLLLQKKHSVGELAETLALPHNAVSQHLNQMKDRGILAVKREGRVAYYKVTNPNARNVIRCIRKHGCGKPGMPKP